MSKLKANIEVNRGSFRLLMNIELEPKVYGLYGPSGSGKTTLLNSLSGLATPTSGIICFNNCEVFNSDTYKNVPVHLRNVGYVFQEGRLFPHLTARQNLLFSRNSANIAEHEFEKVVKLLDIEHLLDQLPSRLSGGQKQRVAIGRALFSQPKLLLLDEPFTALDKNLKRQIIVYLDTIFKTLRIPILIVSHELKDLLLLTKNLILIKDGNISKPKTYLDLICSEELLNFNGKTASFHNVYDAILTNEGISGETASASPVEYPDISISIENTNTKRSVGELVKISMRASDVAISLKKADDISVRNQIAGIIESVIPYSGHFILIVNCRIKIVTRITREAANLLTIEVGKPVYCLFKSMAIESA